MKESEHEANKGEQMRHEGMRNVDRRHGEVFWWTGGECWWEPGTGGVAGVCRSGMFTEIFLCGSLSVGWQHFSETLITIMDTRERTRRESRLSTKPQWAATSTWAQRMEAHTYVHALSSFFLFHKHKNEYFTSPSCPPGLPLHYKVSITTAQKSEGLSLPLHNVTPFKGYWL